MEIFHTKVKTWLKVDQIIEFVLILFNLQDIFVGILLVIDSFFDDEDISLELQKFIRQIGFPYRAMSTGFRFVAITIIPVNYGLDYFTKRAYSRRNQFAKTSGLAVYLREPYIEVNRIELLIDKHIKTIIASNQVYRSIQIQRSLRSKLDTMQIGNLDHHCRGTILRSQPRDFHQNLDRFKVNGHRIDHKQIDEEEFWFVHQQRILIRLLRNKNSKFRSIWPANRVENQRILLISKSFILTATLVTSVWLILTITYTYGHQKMNRLMLADEQLESEARHLDALEKALISIGILNMWHIVDIQCDSVINTRMGLLDQGIYLKQIQERLSNLMSDLAGLKLWKRELVLDIYRQSIELYIMFKVFAGEVNMMFRNIECHLVFYFILQLYQTIAISVLNRSLQLNMASVHVFMGVVNLNLSLYPCAAFNKQCIDLTKTVQSFLAQLESVERSLTSDSNNHKQKSILSCHSRFLWHRILQNQDWVCEMFSCKFAGMMRLDFGLVLQLNYWILSTGLLLFSSANIRSHL